MTFFKVITGCLKTLTEKHKLKITFLVEIINILWKNYAADTHLEAWSVESSIIYKKQKREF